jgi:hypothetical protein
MGQNARTALLARLVGRLPGRLIARTGSLAGPDWPAERIQLAAEQRREPTYMSERRQTRALGPEGPARDG